MSRNVSPSTSRFRSKFLFVAAALSSLLLSPRSSHAIKCPNVQIVMDRSGSMLSGMDMSTRWDVTKAAIKAMVAPLDMKYRFGITIFPDDGLTCAPSTSVRPAYGTKTAIGTALDSKSPDGTSASGTAVKTVATFSELADASRPQYIILITDGTPLCMGEPDSQAGAVAEINKAYMQTPSILTFVIGVGTLASTDVMALDEMAMAGRRPRGSSPTKYYPAETGAGLQNTILEIMTRIGLDVGTCSDTTPVDMRGEDLRGGPEDLRGVTDLRLPDGGPPVEIDLRNPANEDGSGMTLPAPVVDWIEPKTMAAGVGGPAEVIGRNFVAALPSSEVFFDSGSNLSTVPNALVESGGKIKVLVPMELAPGTYDVVVKNPDGQIGRAEQAFTVSGKATGCACSIGSGNQKRADDARLMLSVTAMAALLCGLSLRRTRRRRI